MSSSSQRRIAATLVAAALIAAAVALVWGGNNPVSAFIAEVTGGALDGGPAFGPPGTRSDGSPAASADAAHWDSDDGEDSDALAFADPAVRSLRVRLLSSEQSAAGGIPVVVLGNGENGPVLAGPKYTNSEGRVRFPIDVAMEREHDVTVAARATPGFAATSALKVALDQAADVTMVIDTGIRATIQLVDPEGRPIESGARVRKAILGEPPPEAGPRADLLTQVFAETTPRAMRGTGGLELFGLRSPEECTLVVSAPGFAPVYPTVRIPAQARSPFPIEVKLETRTSIVRFDLAVPAELERDKPAFSWHRVDPSGVVLAAGVDEVPAQRLPQFSIELAPNDAQRLQVCAWTEGRICASTELEVPALREGEVFDAGKVRLEILPVVLAGHVVDQDQGPLANATVEAIGRGRLRDLAATTSADGAFTLRAPAGRGPYQVSAHAPGRVSEKLPSVSEPALDLRLVLEQSGAIQGSILGGAGLDLDRISVRATTDGRAPCTTTPLPGGSFVVTGLARGVYTVVIEGADIHPVRVTDVVVTPPETTRDGRLDRLRPRILSGQGQP